MAESRKESVFPTCPTYHPLSDLRKRSGYYPNLSAEQLEAAHRVKAGLEDVGSFEAFATGLEHPFLKILRFLRARKFDVDATLEMILADLAWRGECNCADLVKKTASDVLNCDFALVFAYFPTWVQGFDKQFRPVSYRQFGKFEIWNILQVTTMERLIMFHAWETEQMLRMMHQKGAEANCNIETFTVVVDAGGWTMGLMTGDALAFVNSMAKTDNSYYPERLGLVIVINAPTMLYWAWKMIEGFLDDVTKAKVKICGTNPDEWQPVLFAAIDEDQVPKQYGGTAPNLLPHEAIMTMDPITPYIPSHHAREGGAAVDLSSRRSSFGFGNGWFRLGGISLVYTEHLARNEKIALVLLILSTICMGCTIVGQRHAMFGTIRPMTFNACRYAVSSLILFAVRPWLRRYLRTYGYTARVSSDDPADQPTLAAQSLESLVNEYHINSTDLDSDYFQQLRYAQKRHEERIKHGERGKRIELFSWGALLGIISATAAALQQIGLESVPAGKAAFVTGLYVTFVPLFEYFLPIFLPGVDGSSTSRWFPWKTLLAVAVGILGILVMTGGWCAQSMGIIFVFSGALCWAACLVATDIATKKIEGVTLTAVEYQTIAVFSFLLALIFESAEISYPFPSITSTWRTILFVGIMEVTGLILSMMGQLYVTPADAASVFSFQAAVASIVGFVFLQEKMGVRDVLGCLLMLAAPLMLISSQGLIQAEDVAIPHVASVDFEEEQRPNRSADSAEAKELQLNFHPDGDDGWNFADQFSSFFGFPVSRSGSVSNFAANDDEKPKPLTASERLQLRASATASAASSSSSSAAAAKAAGSAASSRDTLAQQTSVKESSSLFSRTRPSYSQVRTYDSIAPTATSSKGAIVSSSREEFAYAAASEKAENLLSASGSVEGGTMAISAKYKDAMR